MDKLDSFSVNPFSGIYEHAIEIAKNQSEVGEVVFPITDILKGDIGNIEVFISELMEELESPVCRIYKISGGNIFPLWREFMYTCEDSTVRIVLSSACVEHLDVLDSLSYD